MVKNINKATISKIFMVICKHKTNHHVQVMDPINLGDWSLFSCDIPLLHIHSPCVSLSSIIHLPTTYILTST
ncbi:hypothetical protein CARUB_v10010811mg [Capsella rubella]|uniref:Uncharacterized protein n=1 Tax=Capsella rubella TaxID=81985 RepID=R0GSF4_9BRAS|nr:hypothetical protein CARUB_v10010811mg [Capsella rubella]